MKSLKCNKAALGSLLLALPVAALAQTGQSLIGNPLLSPAKIKEVRRQIAEAAHRDPAAQPAEQAPLPVPMPQPMPMPVLGGMPSRPSGEAERQVLSRLRVMAVVGRSALLAMPPVPEINPMQAPMMPMQAMSPMQPMPMPGFQPGMQAQPLPAQQAPNMRRPTSTMVRDREPAYVEGVDVVPVINGGTVRLVLAAMPNVTVYSGMVQPTQNSPSLAVPASALEKTSNEYVQGTSPDMTSMGPSSSQQPGTQTQGLGQPLRSRQQPGTEGIQQF